MRVLVTGGTGVIGQATVPELLRQGHTVRVLSRRAEEAARQWADGVEVWPASVAEPSTLRGCAEGCDIVL
ncbi:MAG: SDR family oxidoreductase, partial [Gemmatimonadaceae bacterium]